MLKDIQIANSDANIQQLSEVPAKSKVAMNKGYNYDPNGKYKII